MALNYNYYYELRLERERTVHRSRQESRNPTGTARKAFARRRELTRVSLARACALAPAA